MATFLSRPGPRGKRVWQAQIRRRGHAVQIRTFDRKAEAKVWARQLEGEMDRGVFVSRVDAEGTTLRELLDRYQCEITPQKRGAAMERSHIIKVISQDPIARCFIATITGKTLASYRDRRLQVVSASTLNRELNILSHIFSGLSRVSSGSYAVCLVSPALPAPEFDGWMQHYRLLGQDRISSENPHDTR